jgi:opacity protein-like surface antigen
VKAFLNFHEVENVVMRKVAIIVCSLLLFASVASSQVPSGNVFVGYSYYNADLSSLGRSNLNGWNGSLEGKVLPWVGIVADFSGHYGSERVPTIFCQGQPCSSVSVNIHEFDFLFGPRVSVSVGKIRPFAEALFGGAHVSANRAGSDTSFATALGGGIDYHLIPLVALRLEGDYVQTRFFSATQNNVRLSTGIVLRF